MKKVFDGNIGLSNLHLNELFNLSDVEVSGIFDCSNNSLTSLKGSPHTVGGDFDCSNNKLTNLIGAPSTVNGIFVCYNNKLTSIEGLSKTINSHLILDAYIKDKFSEEYIRSRCKIRGTIHFVTAEFEDAGNINDPGVGYGYGETPEELNHIDLSNLELTKLPNLYDVEVTGNFNCSSNYLTNLVGAPKTIHHSFLCDDNDLNSLEGISTFIGGGFFIDKKLEDKFPEEYIRGLCTINGTVRYT